MRSRTLEAAAALAALAGIGIGAGLPTGGASAGTELREGQAAQRDGGQKNRGTAMSALVRAAPHSALSGGIGVPRRGGYRNRCGWTNRRYRRAAAKRRSQARHRAACR